MGNVGIPRSTLNAKQMTPTGLTLQVVLLDAKMKTKSNNFR